MANINDCYQLLKQRANDRGVASNISADRFNIIWPRAELKFFNNAFKLYAETQAISDAIIKWLSDPMYLVIPSTGLYPIGTGLRLIHVDTLNGYIPATTTTGSIGGLDNLVGGSGYASGGGGGFLISLLGGTGQNAEAYVLVIAGAITEIQYFTNIGTGYTVGDTLTTNLAGGTGFSVDVSEIVSPNPVDITRVEKNKIAAHRSSTYDAPNREFPIYTQFSDAIQFYPEDIKIAQLIYLEQPSPSKWGYTLNGFVGTLTALVGGTGYTNGTYTNVPLLGGSGTGLLATIVVSGGAVTSVLVNSRNSGKLYHVGDTLTVLASNVGGTGAGFSIDVSSILNPREVYSAGASIQPLWNDNDISTIVDYCLEDVAINSRDQELQQFAQMQSQSKLAQ